MNRPGRPARRLFITAPDGQKPELSDRQRAAVESVWGQFKSVTDNSIAPHHTKTMRMEDGSTVHMMTSWGTDAMRVSLPKQKAAAAPPPPPPPAGIASYLVINFTYSSGERFTGFTFMESPLFSNYWIGPGEFSSVPSFETSGGSTVMAHVGDNPSGTPRQSHLIVVDPVREADPTGNIIIYLAGHWRGTAGPSVQVTVSAYEFGEPSVNSTGYRILGGTLITSASRSYNVTSQGDYEDRSFMGTLTFNMTTNAITLSGGY